MFVNMFADFSNAQTSHGNAKRFEKGCTKAFSPFRGHDFESSTAKKTKLPGSQKQSSITSQLAKSVKATAKQEEMTLLPQHVSCFLNGQDKIQDDVQTCVQKIETLETRITALQCELQSWKNRVIALENTQSHLNNLRTQMCPAQTSENEWHMIETSEDMCAVMV